MSDLIHMHEAIFFIAPNGISKQIRWLEFEAVLDGVVGLEDCANQKILALYVLFTNHQEIKAVICFHIAFDANGLPPAEWHVPFQRLIYLTAEGSSTVVGIGKIITRRSCALPEYASRLWNPEGLTLAYDLWTELHTAIYHNKLGFNVSPCPGSVVVPRAPAGKPHRSSGVFPQAFAPLVSEVPVSEVPVSDESSPPSQTRDIPPLLSLEQALGTVGGDATLSSEKCLVIIEALVRQTEQEHQEAFAVLQKAHQAEMEYVLRQQEEQARQVHIHKQALQQVQRYLMQTRARVDALEKTLYLSAEHQIRSVAGEPDEVSVERDQLVSSSVSDQSMSEPTGRVRDEQEVSSAAHLNDAVSRGPHGTPYV